MSVQQGVQDQVDLKDEVQPTFTNGAIAFFKDGSMNILLVFAPIAIVLWVVRANEIAVFLMALLAICPLAERLGFVTEQLALHTNHTIGGLLNVTFGNATELIVSVAALFKGYYRLVQLSLLGSILSNLLLVLGTAFFIGGLKNGTQNFKQLTGQINSTVLMLGVMAFLLPSIMSTSRQTSYSNDEDGVLMFSRIVSLVMIIVYGCYIYMELTDDQPDHTKPSHPDHDKKTTNTSQSASTSEASESLTMQHHRIKKRRLRRRLDTITNKAAKVYQTLAHSHHADAPAAAHVNPKAESKANDDSKDDDKDDDVLGFKGALFWLAVVTVVIAILSEALVGSIETATKQVGINGVFVSTIVLPIIGNAAEHASGVVFALKNKMDVSLSIAVGSTTQITVFVTPLLVLISWCANKELDLNFQPYESYSILLSVILVTFAIQGGKSNWLVGVILMSAYFILSVGFYIHTDEEL